MGLTFVVAVSPTGPPYIASVQMRCNKEVGLTLSFGLGSVWTIHWEREIASMKLNGLSGIVLGGYDNI